VYGVPSGSRDGVPGSDNCGVWRIRSSEIMGRRSEGRGSDGRRVELVHSTRNVQVIEWDTLRIVDVVEHESEGINQQ